MVVVIFFDWVEIGHAQKVLDNQVCFGAKIQQTEMKAHGFGYGRRIPMGAVYEGGDGSSRVSEYSRRNGKTLSYRGLQAFRNVVIESSYRNAALNTGGDRRGVLKLVRDLEEDLGAPLFLEERRGRVLASKFGERLFSDMRSLEVAVDRFREKVNLIKNHRRILRVGASPLVFRSVLFRTMFRAFRSFEGCRVSFVPILGDDPVKLLVSGEVDWLFGFECHEGQRLLSEKSGEIPMGKYRRGKVESGKSCAFCVEPRGCDAVSLEDGEQSLAEERFLRWLDHPGECSLGTLVSATLLSVDSHFWDDLSSSTESRQSLPLFATRLRTHPYEFFTKLIEIQKTCIARS